jgi:hypothetical protein
MAYVVSLPERATDGLDQSVRIGMLVADVAVFVGVLFGILVSYVMLFFVPFLVAMPLAVLIARGWRNPAHILLLRPFHRSSATRLLRLDGQIYTLSDSTIKVPWVCQGSGISRTTRIHAIPVSDDPAAEGPRETGGVARQPLASKHQLGPIEEQAVTAEDNRRYVEVVHRAAGPADGSDPCRLELSP